MVKQLKLSEKEETCWYEGSVMYISVYDGVWTSPLCNKYIWLITVHDIRFL